MALWLQLLVAVVAIVAGVCLVLLIFYIKRIVVAVEDVKQKVDEMKAELDPTLVRVRHITIKVDKVIERLSHLGHLLGLSREGQPEEQKGKESGSLLTGLVRGLFHSSRENK
jgi:hypothetical protein